MKLSNKTIFISYDHNEIGYAIGIKLLIESKYSNIKVFIAKDIPHGEHWLKTIIRNVKSAYIFIPIISVESINNRWIHYECGCFVGKHGDRRVLPIAITPMSEISKEPFNHINMVYLYDYEDFLKLFRNLDDLLKTKSVTSFMQSEYYNLLSNLDKKIMLRKRDYKKIKLAYTLNTFKSDGDFEKYFYQAVLDLDPNSIYNNENVFSRIMYKNRESMFVIYKRTISSFDIELFDIDVNDLIDIIVRLNTICTHEDFICLDIYCNKYTEQDKIVRYFNNIYKISFEYDKIQMNINEILNKYIYMKDRNGKILGIYDNNKLSFIGKIPEVIKCYFEISRYLMGAMAAISIENGWSSFLSSILEKNSE